VVAAAVEEREEVDDGFLPRSIRNFARVPVRLIDAGGGTSGRKVVAVAVGGFTAGGRPSLLKESARGSGGPPTMLSGLAGGGGAAALRFFFTMPPSSGGSRGPSPERLTRGEDDTGDEDERSSIERLVRGAGTGIAAAVLADMVATISGGGGGRI